MPNNRDLSLLFSCMKTFRDKVRGCP